MRKVYIIQYQGGNHEDQFAETYEVAKMHLESMGYIEEQPFNEDNNEAGCFTSPESSYFEASRARIISRNLITTKKCESCGKEMEQYNRIGDEYKICSECAAKLPDQREGLIKLAKGLW